MESIILRHYICLDNYCLRKYKLNCINKQTLQFSNINELTKLNVNRQSQDLFIPIKVLENLI